MSPRNLAFVSAWLWTALRANQFRPCAHGRAVGRCRVDGLAQDVVEDIDGPSVLVQCHIADQFDQALNIGAVLQFQRQ